MEALALDTTFLIDLQNERRGRGEPTGAEAFLNRFRRTLLFLPRVAEGEYLEGFPDPESPVARKLPDILRPLEITPAVVNEYARTARFLRRKGTMIGSNDLWIGVTAKVSGLPIATRNTEEFRRIPGLEVLGYGVSA